MHSFPRGTFVIEGDALPLLRSLRRRIVGSSRGDFGMSPAEARVLLMHTCEDAVAGTTKGAVANLIATLESEPELWTVVEAVLGLLPVPRLKVGQTEYWDHPPRWLGPKAIIEGDMKRHGVRPPLAVTRVTSRGSTTARVLARQRFAESGALLDLADPPENTGSEATWMGAESRGGGFAYMRSGWLLHPKLVEGDQLVPPLRQLGRVATRDEDDRGDWERRVLAATRWYARAHRSEWPAHRLAGVIVVTLTL